MRGQEAATGPLSASVKPFVEKQELAGAVMLVANREKVLSTEVAGWSDIAQKRPMTADTFFLDCIAVKADNCGGGDDFGG